MAQAANSLAVPRVPNRVTYQGTTYTICTSCYEVIGSGRTEANLLAVERFHRCPQMDIEEE